MSETSRTKIRSKSASWITLAAAATLALPLLSSPVRADEVDLKAAAKNYSDSCVDCHGQTGKGDGPKAAKLGVPVGDLTDCAKMSKVSDDVMFKVIKEGGPAANLNKAMTPFGDAFEENEIKGLVAYIRSLCKK